MSIYPRRRKMDRWWRIFPRCGSPWYDIWTPKSLGGTTNTLITTRMVDDWTQPKLGHRNIGKWIGETWFFTEDCAPDIALRLIVDNSPDYGMGVLSFEVRGGCEPSECSVLEDGTPLAMTSSLSKSVIHELNHKPASKECDACVRGKGRTSEHTRALSTDLYRNLEISSPWISAPLPITV